MKKKVLLLRKVSLIAIFINRTFFSETFLSRYSHLLINELSLKALEDQPAEKRNSGNADFTDGSRRERVKTFLPFQNLFAKLTKKKIHKCVLVHMHRHMNADILPVY